MFFPFFSLSGSRSTGLFMQSGQGPVQGPSCDSFAAEAVTELHLRIRTRRPCSHTSPTGLSDRALKAPYKTRESHANNTDDLHFALCLSIHLSYLCLSLFYYLSLSPTISCSLSLPISLSRSLDLSLYIQFALSVVFSVYCLFIYLSITLYLPVSLPLALLAANREVMCANCLEKECAAS